LLRGNRATRTVPPREDQPTESQLEERKDSRMGDEKSAQPAKKVKVVKPRPGSKVVPARTKADKARLAEKENFVQVSLPKSLATMTDEEIMQWARGLYKSVVEQLQPANYGAEDSTTSKNEYGFSPQQLEEAKLYL